MVPGQQTTIAWSIGRATASGSFRAWLRDTTTGSWVRITPTATPVAAVAGRTSYSVPWTVGTRLGTYTLYVYYYSDVGGTTTVSRVASSGALTVQPFFASVTPSSGTFTVGSSTTIEWTLNRAVDSGSFRAWLRDTTTGSWVRITPTARPVAAVAGRTSYSVPWTVGTRLGTYTLYVYYYSDVGGTTTVSRVASSGALTVQP